VHLTPVPFGDGGTVGGGERYPAELARAMARIVPTTLLSFGERASVQRDGELLVRTLPIRRLAGGNALSPLSEQLPAALLRSDVVHIHQWESVTANIATVLSRASGRKVFATDHGGWAPNHWRRLRLARLLTGFLPVSDFGASFYPELAERSSTIYGGVDTTQYAPDGPAGEQSNRGTFAMFVGRLLPHKGIDELITALDPATPLRVYGRPYDPGFLDHLKNLACGKAVEFVFDADDATLRRAYRRARVVVLPSLHHPPLGPPAPRAELLGLTLIEAMACGTPVVCTRTGGMPEVVEDGVTGFVVDPLDRAALAGAVRSLSRGGPHWSSMAIAAREAATTRFSWTAVANRALAAYDAVAAPHQATRSKINRRVA
jgi:glycosyltransferase involved in cell wall biosynthesis